MSAKQPDITSYTAATPNGVKISIMLEELGLPYKVHKINTSTDEQKSDWFREINPNGRIPAITDTFSDGKTIRVFESGSIMQYLAAEYDTDYKLSFPPGTREFYEMTNWLFFMNAGVGPMQGQSNHFTRYAPEHIQYGVDRYQNETKRSYGVLDKHLAVTGNDYIVGNKYTIVDIAHWGWVSLSLWAGVDLAEFPTSKKWEERMYARPAVKKGADVPEPWTFRELSKDPKKMEEKAAAGRAWVQKGMKEDAEKNAERSKNASKV